MFAADTSTRRGSPSRPHLGAGWRRSFAFSVPVVRHDIWSSPHMQAALADAVSFLTDDEVVFEFSAKPEVPPRQYPLLDDTTATPFPASEIILFSGGLDSLSGAMHRLTTSEDRVVLVTREGRTKYAAAKDPWQSRSPPFRWPRAARPLQGNAFLGAWT